MRKSIKITIVCLVQLLLVGQAFAACDEGDLIGGGINPGAASRICSVIQSSTRTAVLSVPAFHGKAGATGGWVVTGADKGLATLPQSQTASTLVIPVFVEEGDIITAFKITGQVDSAGGAVTLDADLRKLTPAAGGTADASIGAIAQVAKTADYLVSDSKTLAAAETVASGETFYVLVAGTTAGTTDVEVASVEVTVTRNN